MPQEDAREISEDARPGNVVVEPPDTSGSDDDADEGGAEQQARTPDRSNESGLAPERPQAQRPARAGGRTERRKLWEQNEELRRQVAEIPTRLSQLQRQFDQRLAEIQRAPAPAQQSPSAGGAAHPLDQRITTLSAAVQAELAAMRNHDPRSGQYSLDRYNQLQDELFEAKQERFLRKWMKDRGADPDAPRKPAPPQQTPEEFAYHAEQVQRRNIVVKEYPWIAQEGPEGDRYRAALKHAILAKRAAYNRDDIDIDREACAEVERTLGLTPRRPADPARARRHETIIDGRRPATNGRRAVQVPAEMLSGHGLSPEALSRAIFRDDE